MLGFDTSLLLVIILALLFDFSNGWHDSANAIATVVSTRVLSPLAAVLFAAVLNVFGAFMSTAVAKMIGTGILDPTLINQTVINSALVGAIVWNQITLSLGLPSSSSHALIGGMLGAGIVHAGFEAIKIGGIIKVLQAMLFSPFFGFLMAFGLMVLLGWLFFRTPRAYASKLFKRLQLLSAGFMAFSHGANDAQKAMGIITLALLSGGHIDEAEVPGWVILSCALAMGLGTATGGVENYSYSRNENSQTRTGAWFCSGNRCSSGLNDHSTHRFASQHHSHDYLSNSRPRGG